jgi:hypothetical protein
MITFVKSFRLGNWSQSIFLCSQTWYNLITTDSSSYPRNIGKAFRVHFCPIYKCLLFPSDNIKITPWMHIDNLICHNGSQVVSKFKNTIFHNYLSILLVRHEPVWHLILWTVEQILKDQEFNSSEEIEGIIMKV